MEERYQRRNGYEADCDVIYGDTDSVMVHFRVKDIGRAMELGKEAADFVSKTFVKPIKLEFEKVGAGAKPQPLLHSLASGPQWHQRMHLQVMTCVISRTAQLLPSL